MKVGEMTLNFAVCYYLEALSNTYAYDNSRLVKLEVKIWQKM